MKIEKIIRKIGDSKGIILDKEECSIENLEIDDVVTAKIVKKEKEDKK